MVKVCSRCNTEKPFSEFGHDGRAIDGHRIWCKTCNREYQKLWSREKRKKDNEKIKQQRRESARRNSKNPGNLEASRRYRAKNPMSLHAASLKIYWPDLTGKECVAEYMKLFESQNGCCKICNKHRSSFNKNFAVDHDHNTGRVRALLCQSCNIALGLVEESLDTLTKMSNYIKEVCLG